MVVPLGSGTMFEAFVELSEAFPETTFHIHLSGLSSLLQWLLGRSQIFVFSEQFLLRKLEKFGRWQTCELSRILEYRRIGEVVLGSELALLEVFTKVMSAHIFVKNIVNTSKWCSYFRWYLLNTVPRSLRTTLWTHSMISSFVEVYDRPQYGSSLIFARSSRKRLCHSQTCPCCIHTLPYASSNIRSLWRRCT
jgi:hypothetical protein